MPLSKVSAQLFLFPKHLLSFFRQTQGLKWKTSLSVVVGRLVVHRKTKRGGYGRFRVTRSRYDRQRLSSSRKTKKGHVSNSFPVFRYLASAVNVRSVSGNAALRMQRPVRRVVCVIQEQRLGNTNHFSARYPKTRYPPPTTGLPAFNATPV